ncbi:hypothetical protein EZY14_004135 [Kordia sp. TARA_039_SRF]|nr:hypothetical protein EZY14_004135 [Kordia sp. TARA_039_SRF]
MGIVLKNIMIHYLDKESRSTSAKIDFSKSQLKKNNFSESLITDIHSLINTSPSLKNAIFKKDESNSFKKTLEEYVENSTEANFSSFTRSLKLLREKIEKEFLAKGGYYLFCDYEIDSKRYLAVILLRKKAGINIIKEGDSFLLDSTENINIDKIAMGFRLNFSIYESKSDNRNYLALITTQQDGRLSGYFTDWVLADGLIKDEVNTDNMVKIIKTIPLPIDDKGNEQYNRQDFKKAVFDQVTLRKDKRINLFDLGSIFYGEENKNAFVDYADSEEIIIDRDFRRSAKKWKGLISIKASVPGIKVDIDYDRIGQDGVQIKHDKIIINSPVLAKSIQKQIDDA